MNKSASPEFSEDQLKRAVVYFYTCPQCRVEWALDVTWDDDKRPHCECRECGWTNEEDIEAHASERKEEEEP